MNAEQMKDFKATHAHLLEESAKVEPRIKEIVDAVTTFRRGEHDVDVDESFFLSQGLPTFLFVDGALKSRPQIEGVIWESEINLADLGSAKNRTNLLTHLHHSMMGEAHALTIKKDVVLSSPVRILRISTTGQISFPTLVVRAQRFSQFTLVEESVTLEQNNVTLGETHVFVEDGARVEHLHIQSNHSGSKNTGSTFAHVSKDGLYRNFMFHLKGDLNQRFLDLHIDGSGAHGDSHILYLLNGSEKSTVDTVIHHYTPDSTSAQLAKGILDQDSRGAFTGRIHIHKDAQRVNSSQLNKNLLLSKKAQVFSEPQLEIFADDVKCSHGSTTGQMSPEEVFYFEARGIPHDKARNLLAMGFGMEVVMKVENSEARSYLEGLIGSELKNKFHLGGNS